MVTFSGSKVALFFCTLWPARLNSLSQGIEVAEEARYLCVVRRNKKDNVRKSFKCIKLKAGQMTAAVCHSGTSGI